MAFTAKILSWRFRHLNIVGCLLKRRPTKGGHGHPRTRPRQIVLAKSWKVALFKAKKLLKCCPKTQKLATLIYQYFIQILLNIIDHCSFWIIGKFNILIWSVYLGHMYIIKGLHSCRTKLNILNALASYRCFLFKTVSIKHGLRTTDCGLGIKYGVGIKRGLQTEYKTRTRYKMRSTDWV